MKQLFNWENGNKEFGLYLEYDHLLWTGVPKSDPRGEGFTHQTFEAFQRDGAPKVFEAPGNVLDGVRDLLTQDAWRQVEQWETCVIMVDRMNGNTTITRYGVRTHHERYEGADEAMINRLVTAIRAEGWEDVSAFSGDAMSSRRFRRRWTAG